MVGFGVENMALAFKASKDGGFGLCVGLSGCEAVYENENQEPKGIDIGFEIRA